MSSTNLPEISSLPSLPTTTQHAVIDTLFEPSQHLHNFANALFSQQQEPQQLVHSSYQDLIDAVGTYLSGLSTSSSSQDRAALFEILGSHPRLGEKSPTKLSELSKKEQANLNAAAQQTPGGGNADKDNGVAAAAAEEEEELRRLNGVYEETFPGLRYVYVVALPRGS